MNKVRLGLVGCGPRGTGVAQLFGMHPKCEVTALMDLFEAPMEGAAAALNVPDAPKYTDFDEMLASAPIDAIYFGCDPIDQSALACRAMRAGKHVCTDVPATIEMDDLWNLLETVRDTGCKYQLMEQMRYGGWVDYWTEAVASGELGHICLAQGEYFHYERNWGHFIDVKTGKVSNELVQPRDRETVPTWRYRMLGDPIYYLPHTLSPLLRILDDRVVKVSCMGTRQRSYTYPDEELPWRDIEYALMHTAKDTVLMAGAGFSLPTPWRGQTWHHWYEIRGTKGCLEGPRGSGEWDSFRRWTPGMKAHEKIELSMLPAGATQEQAASGHGGLDYKPVDTFLAAVADGADPTLDIWKAAELTAPAIVAAQSARQGGALLEVPDFRNAFKSG